MSQSVSTDKTLPVSLRKTMNPSTSAMREATKVDLIGDQIISHLMPETVMNFVIAADLQITPENMKFYLSPLRVLFGSVVARRMLREGYQVVFVARTLDLLWKPLKRAEMLLNKTLGTWSLGKTVRDEAKMVTVAVIKNGKVIALPELINRGYLSKDCSFASCDYCRNSRLYAITSVHPPEFEAVDVWGPGCVYNGMGGDVDERVFAKLAGPYPPHGLRMVRSTEKFWGPKGEPLRDFEMMIADADGCRKATKLLIQEYGTFAYSIESVLSTYPVDAPEEEDASPQSVEVDQ